MRFLEEATPSLLRDEARHNLILGIAGTLARRPSVYPEFALWLVEDRGSVVLAALQTPPYNLVLSRPLRNEALVAFCDALEQEGRALPGVTAARPEVDGFVREWAWRGTFASRVRTRQRLYRLAHPPAAPPVPGRPRGATPTERHLLAEWLDAFAAEALPADAPGRASHALVDARPEDSSAGFTLWEDREPVSLAGWGNPTPNGVRIGPVYTPPEHRRRGYGSAVTAAVSAEHLASGRRFCFLYTDLANPTSNRIYTDIGYEPVCDSIDYAFDPIGGS